MIIYDRPDGSYTTKIPPGTQAFRFEVGRMFEYPRTEVIRDRDRCEAQRSEHCECGAIDFFTTDVAKGRLLFNWAVAVADALQIQSVIFNHRVWGFGVETERAYTGPNPHEDHVHIGLNRWARANLTEAMVMAQIEGDDDVGLTPDQATQLRQVNEAMNQVQNVIIPALDKKVTALAGLVTQIQQGVLPTILDNLQAILDKLNHG